MELQIDKLIAGFPTEADEVVVQLTHKQRIRS